MSGSIKTHNNFKTFCMKLSPGWSACKERTNARTQTTTRTRLNNTFPCPPFIKIIIIKYCSTSTTVEWLYTSSSAPIQMENCHKVWATNFKFITLIALRDGLTRRRPLITHALKIYFSPSSIHSTHQQGRNKEVFLFFIPFSPKDRKSVKITLSRFNHQENILMS